MQNISEKNYTLQVAHEQQKSDISHMLPHIQHYTSRDEHDPIRTVLTNVTFVWKKNCDTTRKSGKHSQPKNQNCTKMSTQSQINQEIINLIKPHLKQIG